MSTTKIPPARNWQNHRVGYSLDHDIKWLPVLFLTVYFVSLWNPPLVPIPTMSWMIFFGLALYAYLLQKMRLNMNAARFFWIVFGISALGAIISLLRAPNQDLAMWNTVAMVVNFVGFMLFLPLVAMRQVRRVLLMTLMVVGVLWNFRILDLANSQESLGLGSFGKFGEDKNHIGLCLALVSTASLYLSVFLELPNASPERRLAYRSSLLLLALASVYSLTLIYARSALLTAILGGSIVIGIPFFKRGSKLRWWQGLALIGIIAGAVILMLPRMFEKSPEWNRISNIKNEGVDRAINTYDIRSTLLEKGVYLISQNPLLGVGIGGSRAAVSSPTVDYPHFLIHNSYLTEWAEKGILGIVSYAIWIVVYVQVLRRYFSETTIYDQVLLLLFIPLFFDMNFLDISSINIMMLLILAGIVYEKESASTDVGHRARFR